MAGTIADLERGRVYLILSAPKHEIVSMQTPHGRASTADTRPLVRRDELPPPFLIHAAIVNAHCTVPGDLHPPGPRIPTSRTSLHIQRRVPDGN